MSKARSELFKLENMRIAFAQYLLKPKKDIKSDGSVKLSYQATLLWPKGVELVGKWQSGDTAKVSDILMKVATEAWGDKAVNMIQNGIIKNPLLDGDGPQAVNKKTGERYEGFAGHRFLRVQATDEFPPKVFGDKLGSDGKLVRITNPNDLYSGCYVHAVLNVFTWEHASNGPGMSFGVDMVQFAKPGDRLGGTGAGGGDPNAFFQGVKGGAAPEATKTGEGAGGLFA